MDTKKNWMRIGLVVGLFTAGCAAQAEDHEAEGVTETPGETATAQAADTHASNARRHARSNPRSLLRAWQKRTHAQSRTTTEQEARP